MRKARQRSLKNAEVVIKQDLNDLMRRVTFEPSKALVPEGNMLGEYLRSLKYFDPHNISKEDMHKVYAFRTILSSVDRDLADAFINEFVVGFTLHRDTGRKIKMLHASDEINSIASIIDSLEDRLGKHLNRRNVMISASTLVSKTTDEKLGVVNDIQILIWDGFLDSPSASILYMQKIFDRFRVLYIDKKMIDEHQSEVSIYDLDTNCNVVGELKEIMNSNTDILSIISRKLERYTKENLFERITSWCKFKIRGASRDEKIKDNKERKEKARGIAERLSFFGEENRDRRRISEESEDTRF